MSERSEGEVHVRAMRMVCQTLEEHEGQGLGVDWDVLQQQLDHMDTILQGITDQRQDDAEEIETLRKERDHWRTARQEAIEAGELMQAEIETLRQKLMAAETAVSLQRAGIERLNAFVGRVRNGDVLQALVELDAGTADTAPATDPAPCPECERLQAVIQTARRHLGEYIKWANPDNLRSALVELDAGNREATLNSSVVKDSLTPAEGQQ